ncbi:MAG: protein translocase subunit SecF [Acidobacteria bacterium]|nr:protein translocase subunit SecF [Acidobacteriota bacterium]
MAFWHHIPLGVEFRGGTDAYVRFAQPPDLNRIRADLDRVGLKNPRIQQYGPASDNEVLISLPEVSRAGEASDITAGKNAIIGALEATSPAAQNPANQNKKDLNNASVQDVQDYLVSKDPLRNGGDPKLYGDLARAVIDARDKSAGGVLSSLDQVKVDSRVPGALQDGFFLSNFNVRNVDIVGPTVGRQLQRQAVLAVLYSLAGMLVYLWVRFELIYGAAAVVACFHDTLITVGAFSLANKEISLTVIAAILTLVGYSMNDTIVVFDRIRENIKLMRRERLDVIVNKSINQTLSRTILTSGLTFLTVLSLFLFGGEVLHGFSFALVIGILIGTYSSIAVAAPMLVAYTDWRAQRGAKAVALPAGGGRKVQKSPDLRGVKARG